MRELPLNASENPQNMRDKEEVSGPQPHGRLPTPRTAGHVPNPSEHGDVSAAGRSAVPWAATPNHCPKAAFYLLKCAGATGAEALGVQT
jgi:hypothetical protein